MTEYILRHPEIGIGLVLVAICGWYVAMWATAVMTTKIKHKYNREKDEAWHKEHEKLVELQKDYDALLRIAEQEASAHKVALLVLRKAEANRKKGD